MSRVRSYSANAALAAAALSFAQELSRGDRTAIDWTVLGLIGVALLWNLYRLGGRLYRCGGGKDLWHLQRTLLFWVIGMLNTALIRPEEIGTWKNYLGWGLLIVAACDTIALFRKERAAVRRANATPSD